MGNSISYDDEMLDQEVVNKMFDEKALKKAITNKTKGELRENYDNITSKIGLIETKSHLEEIIFYYYSFTPIE